ncbi:hypothetical protein RCL_jg4996.t1 [Rhizophagus clarus]|uniref:Uncharacterized protein n=1 Tax=Rhizophagus clarus TaxID=94130 RepID=A0A8H3QIN1_9GLOM|nr:hypothetical protein RCL_jg4996.t1 [Rhizophagus clarus]
MQLYGSSTSFKLSFPSKRATSFVSFSTSRILSLCRQPRRRHFERIYLLYLEFYRLISTKNILMFTRTMDPVGYSS